MNEAETQCRQPNRLHNIWAISRVQKVSYAQDRRGHLRASKVGQCCSQISEFYRSFSLAKLYFAKFAKETVLKWKIWNCYFLLNFIALPMIYFLNFWIKIEFSAGKASSIFVSKEPFKTVFLQFLEWKWMYVHQLTNLR